MPMVVSEIVSQKRDFRVFVDYTGVSKIPTVQNSWHQSMMTLRVVMINIAIFT